jgi:hypothetical protein
MILHIRHSSVEIPEQFRNQIVLSDADNDTIGDVCDPEPGCGGCGATQCETECRLSLHGNNKLLKKYNNYLEGT